MSTWFPTPPSPDNHLYDYANKVWAGMTRDYYLPRYELFADAKAAAIAAKTAVNATLYREALTGLGAAFTRSQKVYPAGPTGDAIAISRDLYAKYAVSQT